MSRFELKTEFKPAGDQPQAIKDLVAGLKKGLKHQTLSPRRNLGERVSRRGQSLLVFRQRSWAIFV